MKRSLCTIAVVAATLCGTATDESCAHEGHADWEAVDYPTEFQRALDAQDQKHKAIVALLKEHGAKRLPAWPKTHR